MYLPKRFSACLAWLFVAFVVFGQGEIWVAPGGDDAAIGTAEDPVQSLAMGIRRARDWRRLSHPAAAEGVKIVLADGVHRLRETVYVRPEDSGTKDRPLVVEAAPGAQPVLSGGIPSWPVEAGRR